jgi:hypothetical protein
MLDLSKNPSLCEVHFLTKELTMNQNELGKTTADPKAENISSPLGENIVLFSSFLVYVLNGAGIVVLSILIFMGLNSGGWGVLVIFPALPALAICILSLMAGSLKRKKTRRAALIINAVLLIILLGPLQGGEILFSDYHSSDKIFVFSLVFIPIVVNLFLLACLESIVRIQARLAATQERNRSAQF